SRRAPGGGRTRATRDRWASALLRSSGPTPGGDRDGGRAHRQQATAHGQQRQDVGAGVGQPVGALGRRRSGHREGRLGGDAAGQAGHGHGGRAGLQARGGGEGEGGGAGD